MKSQIARRRTSWSRFVKGNVASDPSHRSLVAFGPKQRAIGEAAKTQETSNFKNTIGSLKRLIGRTFSDPEVQEFEKKFLNVKLVDVQGTIGVQVRARWRSKSWRALMSPAG